MSERNLDILIKLAVQGDAEAKEKLKQVIASGTAEQKQSIEAYKGVLDGMEKEIDAQKKVLGETEKGTDAKKKYREGMKGLALQFPLLARVMSLLADPIGAAIALFGTLIAVLKNYSDSVRAAGIASQALEQAAVTAETLAAAYREVAEATKKFHTEFEKIAGDSEKATTKLAEYNKMLLLKQQLEQALDDAQLDAELEKIEGDDSLSPAEKIQKRAAANSRARGRTADRQERTLELQANADATFAGNEARRAQRLRDQAAEVGGQIGPANAAAKAAADEAGAFPKSQEQAREENAEMLETVRLYMEAGKGGFRAVAGTALMNPTGAAKLTNRFGPQPMEEIEKKLLEEEEGLDRQSAAMTKRAADKKAEAERLTDQWTELKTAASAAQKTSVDKTSSAASTWNELQMKRGARGERDPVVEGTAKEKANRESRKERDQEEAEQEKALEYLRRINRPGAPSSNDGSSLSPQSESLIGGGAVASVEASAALERKLGELIEAHNNLTKRVDDMRIA